MAVRARSKGVPGGSAGRCERQVGTVRAEESLPVPNRSCRSARPRGILSCANAFGGRPFASGRRPDTRAETGAGIAELGAPSLFPTRELRLPLCLAVALALSLLALSHASRADDPVPDKATPDATAQPPDSGDQAPSPAPDASASQPQKPSPYDITV
ncbi:MAG TPA: hypothetical protein DEP35_10300, partial [Deltaproteobacteria bacterium]|nr:hypothetical protein [Deltaproteobacteria bacterium]